MRLHATACPISPSGKLMAAHVTQVTTQRLWERNLQDSGWGVRAWESCSFLDGYYLFSCRTISKEFSNKDISGRNLQARIFPTRPGSFQMMGNLRTSLNSCLKSFFKSCTVDPSLNLKYNDRYQSYDECLEFFPSWKLILLLS